MKACTLATALSLGLLGVTPSAHALEGQSVLYATADAEKIEGTIDKIDAEQKWFVVKNGELTSSILVNEKTLFTLDGKKVSMSEALQIGRPVVVTHEARTATRVDAKTT